MKYKLKYILKRAIYIFFPAFFLGWMLYIWSGYDADKTYYKYFWNDFIIEKSKVYELHYGPTRWVEVGENKATRFKESLKGSEVVNISEEQFMGGNSSYKLDSFLCDHIIISEWNDKIIVSTQPEFFGFHIDGWFGHPRHAYMEIKSQQNIQYPE